MITVSATLQKKKNIYYAVLYYKDEFNNIQRKWISTKLKVKNNKKLAERKVEEIRYEYEKTLNEKPTLSGLDVNNKANIKFCDFMLNWLEIIKPRVVIGVPAGITEVEERAVQEAALSCGVREVYLIEEPMAAAIGSGLRIEEPTGNMIVDIGGGTTEIAVVSLGGIVTSTSIKIAGDEMTEDIINYAKRYLDMVIGEVTAEEVKMEIGCAMPFMTELKKVIRGRDLRTGLPVKKEISSVEVQEAMKDSINKIVEGVKSTLEVTPPELSSDIIVNGIMLAGGGALIKNLDKLISEKTGIHVNIAENALDCVANGTMAVLENIDKLKNVVSMSYGRR